MMEAGSEAPPSIEEEQTLSNKYFIRDQGKRH